MSEADVKEVRKMFDGSQLAAMKAIEEHCYADFLASEHFQYILELKAKEGVVPSLVDFQLIRVLGLHLAVPDLLRLTGDHGAVGALPEAAGPHRPDHALEAAIVDPGPQPVEHLVTAGPRAGPARVLIAPIVEANEEHPLISGHQSLAPASGAGVCLSTCLASTSFWTSLVPS